MIDRRSRSGLWFGLKIVFGVVKRLKTLILFSLFAATLALNVAMMLLTAVNTAVSTAFSAATGLRTVAEQNAADLADLSETLASERKVNRELRAEAADLGDTVVRERKIAADLTQQLEAERLVSRNLRGEVTELTSDLTNQRRLASQLSEKLDAQATRRVLFKGRRVTVAEAAETTADTVSRRARNSASRELGSMAGEALPWVGTAVIVGVTALELKDLCDTIRDMNALKIAFNPELEPSEDELTVCSARVPSREELWASTKASPGVAWAKAKELTPTLEDLKSIEVPELDWSSYRQSVSTGISDTYDATLEGISGVTDATKEALSGAWERITGADEKSGGE